jgi:hypothetical protein
LNKLPQFPKTKLQITKKRECEENIDTITKELGKIKQELREIKLNENN